MNSQGSFRLISAAHRVRAFLAIDPRRVEGIVALIPAYFLAILLLLPHVHVHQGGTLAELLKCQIIHNCPRLVSAAIFNLVSFLANGVTAFFASGNSELKSLVPPSWFHVQPMIGDYLFRLVILSPLVPFIAMTSRRLGYGLFFLAAFMLMSSGWGMFQPVLMTDALRFVRPDQMMDFWEFGRMQNLVAFDLFSLSFLLVVSLLLACRSPSPAQMAALAAFGQIGYEHLGFITGVGAFFYVLLAGPGPVRSRPYSALRMLAACGLASIAALGAIALLVTFNNDGALHLAQASVPFSDDIFRFAKYNVDNYRYILFRAAFFLFFPAAFGAISGFVVGLLDPLDDFWRARYRALAKSLLAVLIGYFGTLVIGFFTVITYSSEMARELYAFIIILFFLALAIGALSGSAIRRRVAPIA